MIPLLFIAPFLTDLGNGHIIPPWTIEILSVALIGGGYEAGLVFLERSNTGFDPALSSMRDPEAVVGHDSTGDAGEFSPDKKDTGSRVRSAADCDCRQDAPKLQG